MEKSTNKRAIYLRERYHRDPVFKKKHQDRSRAYYHQPGIREERLKYFKEYSKRPEVKARLAVYMPNYLQKYYKVNRKSPTEKQGLNWKQNKH